VDTVLRVGNASGFYGDRFAAFREMLEGGQLDVLTGDYLAELTMLILGRQRMQHPERGYANTFLRQMEDCLSIALERGVTIVTNAGGLNPAGLVAALRDVASRLGLRVRIAFVQGDDLTPRAGELGLGSPLAANAYLGAWGIAECVASGADIVVTGRVTDASLVIGPAAAHFGWHRDDWDALAGATVAGHVLECGAQATGGNYSFFTEHDVHHPGFPIAEMRADGSCVITKHAGTGGAVTVETVTAQLLYEIDGPRYLGPDVVSRFDTITLVSDGADRVRVTGVRGEPPPPTLKVSCNTLGGYRNAVVFVLCGTDIDAKAALVRDQLDAALAASPPEQIRWTLARTDHADSDDEEAASALLHCMVRDPDSAIAGRAFSARAVEIGLSSYPGFHLTAPPADASPVGVYRAGFVPAGAVEHVAVLDDGSRIAIAPAPETRIPRTELDDTVAPLPAPPLPGHSRRARLGTVTGARSGDKGGNANLGVWARSDAAWPWLVHALTIDELRRLLPETAGLPVRRHVFANLRALNFVIEGLLGEGVASSTRFDPQAKALGEWLRSRVIDIPEELL
jgi:Acyclic terpene utilisation family protein AtuA